MELAIGENNKEVTKLFTPAAIPMWVAVFNEFTKYNIEDSRFVDFLNAYATDLKDRTVDGVSMKTFKSEQSKENYHHGKNQSIGYSYEGLFTY